MSSSWPTGKPDIALQASGSEQDLAKLKYDYDSDSDSDTTSCSRRKGKEKVLNGVDDIVEKEDSHELGYPPMNDEEAETRRVEENLRRWEVAERQRRKAARESVVPRSVTLVGGLANLLWPGSEKPQAARRGDPSLGKHAALQSREDVDVVPLDDIPTSPTLTSSPRPSLAPFNLHQDPFANPCHSPMQLQCPTLMREPSASSMPPSTPPRVPARSIFQASGCAILGMTCPPTPRPLGIPPPSTPPPLGTPVSRAHQGLPAPAEDDAGPMRWWHEWLCGCGGAPDRDGEDQAGKTNPFE